MNQGAKIEQRTAHSASCIHSACLAPFASAGRFANRFSRPGGLRAVAQVQRRQPGAQIGVGGLHGGRRAFHAQVDVAAVFGVIHAGQAEDFQERLSGALITLLILAITP